MIQALARLRSGKSVAIYARLNPDDYSTWVSTALQQKTTSRTTAHLPVAIDDHGTVAAFQLASIYFRQAAADVAGESTINDTEWASCSPSHCGGGGEPGAGPPCPTPPRNVLRVSLPSPGRS